MQNLSSDRKPQSLLILFLLTPVLLLGAGLAQGANEPPAGVDQATFDGKVRPPVKQFCGECHGAKASGGVNLLQTGDMAALQRDKAIWRKALTRLRDRSMPPSGAPQPTGEQREFLIEWLTQVLDHADGRTTPDNPGRVLIHRLSRSEYNNTVHDLFGVALRPADSFPADGGGGGGFDNNADTLFLPPILMERYLAAAGDVLDAAGSKRICFVTPGKGMSKRVAAQRILTHYATLAYRRPAAPAEVDRLLRLFDGAIRRGQSFEGAVKFALKATLISPNFLYRAEQDRGDGRAHTLNDYELASRLSYFLWSSMPDAELFTLAARNRLHDPVVLDAQVRRMLSSPKAHALADSFVSQWLKVRDLYTTAKPDPGRFPNFTPALRDAMYNETIDFFDSVLREDASLLLLLDADYTYLNEDLARYYGVPGVTGPQMRRVSLTDRRRGGVLTMGSTLTLTSFPERTSPVLRGKWVLQQILGAPPTPPPPNAGGLPVDDKPEGGLTFRQRLEKHRAKPECASCHARMDPIGFGLENFDAVGRWRDTVGGTPVDASGVLASGEKFSGPIELKQRLLQQKDDFLRNLATELLAYALGRGIEPYDLPTVNRIKTAVTRDGYRSTTLIREIVKSYPFRYRL